MSPMNLMIKSGARYRMASKEEILAVAAQYRVNDISMRCCVDAPDAARRFLTDALAARDSEVFCAIWLDTRHRVLSFDELFKGTIDGASVHPREVVKRALERNAAAVILAHNHPSGVAEPTHADELITSRLRDALALIDVRVMDHMIVGADSCMSFVERGLL